ncbi:N-acetyltransferase family protein [Rhizobium calliandrae]|uniref:N-acetyltransferase family protein n=1 Tax=Rhizobium calliandrae TaxID=1312182 RepID=A0ABT7K7T2_9HYPH|nr:GNAT family N-acetyltransferase [Rhizobium calliandrae]MDL2404075.1 N-acetyltransferase family protein [Rhizobium calliandrae]
MSFRLRNVTPTDLPFITSIYCDSVLHGTASYEIIPPNEKEMAGRFQAIRDKGYPYIAAEDEDGAFLGYAYASAFRTRPAYRWMVEDSIYLAPEARGRGIGKVLLAALVETSKTLGFRQMIAVIGGAHPASVALHRAAGFVETGLLKGAGYKHGRWLDTMLMQKALGDGAESDPDPSVYPGTLFGG